MTLQLILRDQHPEVVLALTEHLAPLDRVEVGVGDILVAGVDAVVVPVQDVSPMDGGLVASCRTVFGTRPWSRLKTLVDKRFNGAIPVGEAVAVSTGMPGVAWLIAAPTRNQGRWLGDRVHSDFYGRVRLFGEVASREELVTGMAFEPPVGPTVTAEQGAELALGAAIREARQLGIPRLGCTGLGTGAGGGRPDVCAAAMARAWRAHGG